MRLELERFDNGRYVEIPSRSEFAKFSRHAKKVITSEFVGQCYKDFSFLNSYADFVPILLSDNCGYYNTTNFFGTHTKIVKEAKGYFAIRPQIRLKLDFVSKVERDAMIKLLQSTKTITFGSYPRTVVDKVLSANLENEYNKSQEDSKLIPTGHGYAMSNLKFENKAISFNMVPEFEYQGKKYVRLATVGLFDMTDSTNREIIWVEVEPIVWDITQMLERTNVMQEFDDVYVDCYSKEALFKFEHSQNVSTRNLLDFMNNEKNDTEFSSFGNFVNDAFFKVPNRQVIVIPESQKQVSSSVFLGFKTIESVSIPIHTHIMKNALFGTNLKYFDYDVGENRFVVSSQKLSGKERDLDMCFDTFYNVSINSIKKFSPTELNILDTLQKAGCAMDYGYIKELKEHGELENFVKNSTLKGYRYICNEIYRGKTTKWIETNNKGLLKLYRALGGFSKDYVLDKDGNPTDVKISQLASSIIIILNEQDKLQSLID